MVFNGKVDICVIVILWSDLIFYKKKGSNIVTGGLGVLETVGRKTFQAINDKDQNLKQTREFLKNVPTTMNQKPNLSEV